MRKAISTAAAVGGLAALSLVTAGSAEAASDAQWDRLAKCESGGDWGINTGNGFYGGLQFTYSTWRGYGGQQYARTADKATREQQIEIAAKVAASQGWGAWPVCSRKAGMWGAAPTAPGSVVTRAGEAASRDATRRPISSSTNPAKGGSVGKGKHVVRSGESLSIIARDSRVRGGWQALFAANRSTMKNPNVLAVGQVINLV